MAALLRLGLVVLAFAFVAGGASHLYRIATRLRPKADAAAASTADAKLVVYTTKTCPACRMARTYMAGHDIAYEERDIEDPSMRAELRGLGGRGGVPTFVVAGEMVEGWESSGSTLEHALKRHGLR